MPEMLQTCEAFERKCLLGEAASPADALAACERYLALLESLYPQQLVAPHVLGAEALDNEGDGAPALPPAGEGGGGSRRGRAGAAAASLQAS